MYLLSNWGTKRSPALSERGLLEGLRGPPCGPRGGPRDPQVHLPVPDKRSALGGAPGAASVSSAAGPLTAANVPLPVLLFSGFRAGLLTFGGAYTAIPFIRRDAVVENPSTVPWMTDPQFLDGLALSGILPAPLIIFGTFVGYLGGGPAGALVVTAGIFLPAFAFTLIGHGMLERTVENTTLHALLDGVTAGVVGLIGATTLSLFRAEITGVPAAGIFALALLVLYRWKAKAAVAGVVLGAGLLGVIFFR